MNKKILSSVLCLFVLSCPCLIGGEVTLCGYENMAISGHRFEISVSYDETSVTLRSDKTLENVYVVIKDFDGNIIYNGWTVIDQQSNTIVMPIEEGTEKYTIEVYVDEECQVGYFD